MRRLRRETGAYLNDKLEGMLPRGDTGRGLEGMEESGSLRSTFFLQDKRMQGPPTWLYVPHVTEISMPWTGPSKPMPAAGEAAAKVQADGALPVGGNGLVACVVENRARETCITCIHTQNLLNMQVYFVADSQSYGETLDLLHSLQPDEVLMSEAARNRPLSRKILSLAWPGQQAGGPHRCRFTFMNRTFLDQDKGAELLKELSSQPIDSDILEKYIFLASAYCLLRYLQNTGGVRLREKCLVIEFGYGYGGRLVIDRATARDLEIVCNARTGSQKESLFGIINHTKTDVGARFLKAQLLGPPTDEATINTRLQMVEFILASDRFQGSLPSPESAC
jgi:DNA mismatch repair ATPase MutS